MNQLIETLSGDLWVLVLFGEVHRESQLAGVGFFLHPVLQPVKKVVQKRIVGGPFPKDTQAFGSYPGSELF